MLQLVMGALAIIVIIFLLLKATIAFIAFFAIGFVIMAVHSWRENKCESIFYGIVAILLVRLILWLLT